MRDLLGGKGAGVAEMTRAGLPVPPGFTITTEACNAFYARGAKFPEGLWEQVEKSLKVVESGPPARGSAIRATRCSSAFAAVPSSRCRA